LLGLNVRHPLWNALVALAKVAAPTVDVVRAGLADVDDIDDAFVFGSTASGEQREDSDIDILIVGSPPERAISRRTLDLGALLGREVNPLVLSEEEWREKRKSRRPFWISVVQGPKVWVVRQGMPVHAGQPVSQRGTTT
jgi:predicted nucleotidyltransferase